MGNPFPGMDPYMEQQWGDAHHSLVTYARDALRRVLPDDLRPRVEERVFVETPFEPVVFEIGDEPMTQGLVQIIDVRSGGRVVTVIVVLSPANKGTGKGWRLYLRKQEECKEANVNLVEIDLLRAGRGALVVSDSLIPDNLRTPYRVCVWRAAKPFRAEYYPLPLRQRLPAIRIPLRETDADVTLDLQPLLDLAYENGSYDETDYKRAPVPAFEPDDAAWVGALLREKGLR